MRMKMTILTMTMIMKKKKTTNQLGISGPIHQLDMTQFHLQDDNEYQGQMRPQEFVVDRNLRNVDYEMTAVQKGM